MTKTITPNPFTDIAFSQNWNRKLFADHFTTIRLPNPKKYEVGKVYRIILKGELAIHAEIIAVKYIFLHELDDFTAFQDTGRNRNETQDILRKLYPDYDFERNKIAVVLLRNLAFIWPAVGESF